jgi:hypothetical protein
MAYFMEVNGMKKRKLLLFLVATLLGLSTSAGAYDVAIQNAGFEDPVWDDGDWGYGVPGWDTFGPGPSSGTWNPDATGAIFYGYGGNAPEGQNVGWMESGWLDNTPDDPDDDDFTNVDGGLAQVLTETLTAGMTYTLTVEVGNSFYYAWGEGYKIQLLAGGSLLAQDDSSQTPATDTFATSTVTYTYDLAHSDLLGEPLEIRLLAKPGNGELDVDDVRLDAVPEPATMGLLGMGALALIRRRKRK